MNLTTVIGARPQFIKASFLSKQFLKRGISERIIHTGQHYDSNMSEIFFSQLKIPKPVLNLGVSGKSHGALTGEMLKQIEMDLLANKPDALLVYGDTDSTLAGALAATKQHIPVVHVEAGLRSYDRNMPEEVNRVLTDHVSSLLLCPTQTAIDNLAVEGITKGVEMIGDVMHYVLQSMKPIARENTTIISDMNLEGVDYYLATIHRAENTNDLLILKRLMDTLDSLEKPIVMPLHPRTRKLLQKLNWEPKSSNFFVIEPQSYLDMLALIDNSKIVLTDSGGLQKEAVWLSVPCVTMRDTTEWVETIKSGWNILAGTEPANILSAVANFERNWESSETNFEKGRPAEEIVGLIRKLS